MAFRCVLGAFVVQIGFSDSANGYDIILYGYNAQRLGGGRCRAKRIGVLLGEWERAGGVAA